MSAEENLKKLGLTLPSIPTPVANYVPWKRDGNTIYLEPANPKYKTLVVKPPNTVEIQGIFTGLVRINRD